MIWGGITDTTCIVGYVLGAKGLAREPAWRWSRKTKMDIEKSSGRHRIGIGIQEIDSESCVGNPSMQSRTPATSSGKACRVHLS